MSYFKWVSSAPHRSSQDTRKLFTSKIWMKWSLDSPFLQGRSELLLPSLEGWSEKSKKGWKYGTEKGLLKRGTDTFPIPFLQDLFLHLEIILLFAKLCYRFEEKRFFCHHNIMKNIILSCLKMSLCVCVRKFGCWIRTGGGCLREGWGVVWSTVGVE